jgi:hypothetical protein
MAIEDLLGRLARGDGRYGIVTEFIGESGGRGADGVTWLLRATDGQRLGLVELEMTGSDGGFQDMDVDPRAVEYLAEGLAGNFPSDVRLPAMAARSKFIRPLPVRRSDLDRARRWMGSPDLFSG